MSLRAPLASIWAAAALLVWLPAAAAAPPDAVSVPHAADRPRIDGRLDDPAWRAAADLGPLTQREPREGARPSEPTRVLLLLDDEALYIAVRCDDSRAGAIVRTQMTRDADLAQDDNIAIVVVFLVVNVGRLKGEDRWSPAYERITSKVQYTLRF